jgi:plasmid stabilization system protein ParE
LDEWSEAIEFYEEQAPNLGRDLLDEVDRLLAVLEETPGLGSPLDDTFRRLFCRRFPFAVIYREDDEVIRVQAIMHLRRKPDYWRERK